MTTDDLDFFLLDIVSTHTHSLTIFSHPDIGVALNCRVPPHTRSELIAALQELVACGVIELELREPGRRPQLIQPNQDEIEAGIAGALKIHYRLTAQGGVRWSELVAVDWSRWVHDCWSTKQTAAITTASRELTEFLFEVELRKGKTRGPGRWKELRPWRPVYWHEEPVGFQIRYRTISNESKQYSSFPIHWQSQISNRLSRPKLQPRRDRVVSQTPRPFEVLTEEQLQARIWNGSVRHRFAVATELGRRPGSDRALTLNLECYCSAIQFAAARALGRRKGREAVPALLRQMFNRDHKSAAEALGQIGDKRAFGPMVTLQWNGSHAVGRALLRFGNQGIERLDGLAMKQPELEDSISHVLRHSTSPRAVEILIRQMSKRGYPASELLGQMGDDARTVLFGLASDETQPFRSHRAAARGLAESDGVFHDDGCLMTESFDRDFKQREWERLVAYLVSGTAKHEIEDPTAALMALLRDPSHDKRRQAIDLLVQSDVESAASDIALLATDEHWEVRASVACALASWRTQDEVLETLRRDTDIIVRGCARWFA